MAENLPRELNRTSAGFSRSVGYIALLLVLLSALYAIVRIARVTLAGATDSFATVLRDPAFTRFLLTAATAATAVSVSVVLVGWLIAKASSRRSPPANTTNAALAAKVFAIPLLLLPLYAVAVRLGEIPAEIGVVIIAIAVALPFCIWQLKAFYDAIPAAIEEAALLDGCSRGQILRLILLPLLWPALVVGAAFSFMSAWVACTFLPLIAGFDFGDSRAIAFATEGARSSTYAAAALLLLVPLLLALLFFGWRLRRAAVESWNTDAGASSARRFN